MNNIIVIIVLLIILIIKLLFLSNFKKIVNIFLYYVYLIISLFSYIFFIITIINIWNIGLSRMTVFNNISISIFISLIVLESTLTLIFQFINLIYYIKKFFIRKDKLNKTDYSKRDLIKKSTLALSLFPLGALAKGIISGKYDYKVRKVKLVFDNLPKEFDGFTITQFSDLHCGSFDNKEAVSRGFDIIQAQNSNLILFTGDLVNHYSHEVIPYVDMLTRLKAEYGKFSVLGNHDFPVDSILFIDEEHKVSNLQEIINYHKTCDFELLRNTNVQIYKNGKYIRLIGVDNWGKGFIKYGDFDKAIINTEQNEFSILMSHDPTHWEEVVKDHHKHIDITLSGHTHGFQMGIDTKNWKFSPFQLIYPKWAGLYEENNRKIYINRGFGFIGYAGRVGVLPEITVFELKSK